MIGAPLGLEKVNGALQVTARRDDVAEDHDTRATRELRRVLTECKRVGTKLQEEVCACATGLSLTPSAFVT